MVRSGEGRLGLEIGEISNLRAACLVGRVSLKIVIPGGIVCEEGGGPIKIASVDRLAKSGLAQQYITKSIMF